MTARKALVVGLALLATVVVVVVVVVAVVVVVGLGGAAAGAATRPGTVDPRIGPTLEIRARDEGEIVPSTTVDDLDDDGVVHVVARGFTPDHDGSARQCGGGSGDPPCGPAIPVRFDETGTARTLFLLDADVVGWGRCDAAGARCELVVSDGEGRIGAVRIVFGGRAPRPPTVAVTPTGGIAGGDRLEVVVTGAPPGTRIAVALCAAPARTDADCARPAVRVVADDRGRASAALTAEGDATTRCARRDPCRVGVLVEGQVQATSARLAWATGPGPGYDGTRLALGLLAAAALLLGAWTISRSTAWTTPDEAPGAGVA